MEQLLLNIADDSYPALDIFLGMRNRELLHTLRARREKLVYVWGGSGTGKSHLLHAWIGEAEKDGLKARYFARDSGAWHTLSPDEPFDCVAVDDVHNISADDAAALFALFNRWHAAGTFLLFSAQMPPPALPLREDLRSRLGWGVAYELHLLSDEEKLHALKEMAQARQMTVGDEVFRYLLTHFSRNINDLIALLVSADKYALAHKQPITTHLIKKVKEQFFP